MVVPQDFKRPFSPSNKDEPLVGAGTKEPEASSSKGDSFDPKLAKPLNRSPHSALRYRKSFQYRPLDKVRAWAVYKAISAKNEEVFKERLHQQKMKCLEEEHDLKIQILEQQIRHAEEQQSWLREEHIAKLERIKSTK